MKILVFLTATMISVVSFASTLDCHFAMTVNGERHRDSIKVDVSEGFAGLFKPVSERGVEIELLPVELYEADEAALKRFHKNYAFIITRGAYTSGDNPANRTLSVYEIDMSKFSRDASTLAMQRMGVHDFLASADGSTERIGLSMNAGLSIHSLSVSCESAAR